MLKIGIIGAGSIAEHHESNLAVLDDCRITAVCDIRREAAEAMAQKHGAEVFENYIELLQTGVDIVYICTPPYLHKEMALAAAEAGKHIFLEKPACLSYEDCAEIKAAIDKAGVKCQVGYVVGFRPAEDTARRMFKRGRVGGLVSVWDKRMSNASFLTDAVGTYRDWLIDIKRSGGVLLECMTHEVAWLLSIGGEVSSVYANIQFTNPNPKINVDDNCWAILNFKSGGVGVLGTSWSNPIYGGEKGILGVNGVLEVMADTVKIGNRETNSQEEIQGEADENLSKQAYFNKCVREGLKPRNSIEEAMYNIRVILAMHQSCRTNQVVTVD